MLPSRYHRIGDREINPHRMIPGLEQLDPNNPVHAAMLASVRLNMNTLLMGFQDIIDDELSRPGATIQSIRAALATCHPAVQFPKAKALKRAIFHTALSNPYYPAECEITNNGPPQYLSPDDYVRLQDEVELFEADGNPYSRDEFVLNAYNIHQRRIQSAITKLAPFPKLRAKAEAMLGVQPPDNLHTLFTQVTGFNFLIPRSVDLNRQFAANTHRLTRWFVSHDVVLRNKDPRLILNGDEMGVDSNTGRLRVLTRSSTPVVAAAAQTPHITMFCVATAAGVAIPPFIILNSLVNLPRELLIYNESVWFASTRSGWQTEASFYAWAVHFTHWAATYRTQLPRPLQEETIILVLDGHSSRACPEALQLLSIHRIELIILPSHTTHVLQPFDVGLASPLRAAFHKFRRTARTQLVMTHIRTQAGKLRFVAVDSLIRAWQSAASLLNIQSAFAQTGLFPWSLAAALRSPFAIDGPFVEPRRNNLSINDLHITIPVIANLRDEKLTRRPAWPLAQFGSIFADNYPHANDRDIVTWLQSNDAARTIAGQPLVDVYLMTTPNPDYPLQVITNAATGTYVWVLYT